jgi:hypothetical protein
MLYGQMYAPRGRKRRTLSAKIPILSASIESESKEAVGEDRKLRLVEEELEARQLIGTLSEHKTYFKGTMSMRWGLYDDRGHRPDEEPALVYFGGFEKAEPLLVGLGGSSKHVIGHEGATSTWSRSATPTLVHWLTAGIQQDAPPETLVSWDERQEEADLFAAMAIALRYLKPPNQDLEFLAKTLKSGIVHKQDSYIGVPSARVILGTPLYVAQAHPLPDSKTWGLDDQW